jgi:hypothetical protein
VIYLSLLIDDCQKQRDGFNVCLSPMQCSETQCSAKEIAMALQLVLPLEADSRNEIPLRQAWVRSGLSLPYELALRNRAIAICLRGLADAMRIKHGGKRRG